MMYKCADCGRRTAYLYGDVCHECVHSLCTQHSQDEEDTLLALGRDPEPEYRTIEMGGA